MKDEDYEITERTIKVGQTFIEEGLPQLQLKFVKENYREASMPSLLYGMASVILEAIYASAPNNEEAERVINMALTSAQESTALFNKLKEEAGNE